MKNSINNGRFEITLDLPVLSQNKHGVNVLYKGVNVFVGLKALGKGLIDDLHLICLVSENKESPVYKGGFLELWTKRNETMSALLERCI